MLENKGFTLIEAIFALSIFCVIYIELITLLYNGYYKSEKINQLNHLQSYEQVLDSEFYPITDLSLIIEDILSV